MEAAQESNALISRNYTKERKLGEGTYAVVYSGRQLSTKRQIAIKKIKLSSATSRDGLDMSAIREVKFLQELKGHPNVIELLDVYSTSSNLSLVLELLVTDLEELIRDKTLIFQSQDIKSWCLMMFRGLEFCHRNWVMHRDLKPNNLFLGADGTLKIADFGLAREFPDPGSKMTCQVVTRWYRPPELLMGARFYNATVDCWSAGCILAELLLRVPYMAGETDVQQLEKIYSALGTPTEEDWPGHTKLQDFMQFPKVAKPPLQHLFSASSNDTLDFLGRLLAFNPKKRLTALQALSHPYFKNLPKPTHPSRLPQTARILKPRELPPEEGLKKKRKGDVEFQEPETRRVARKLEF